MIDFLFKGLIRDKSRSFFPVIIITLIVSIIIFFSWFLNGVYNSLFLNTAILNSGHVKVVTHAYNLENQLLPNDLALLDVNSIFSTDSSNIRINEGLDVVGGVISKSLSYSNFSGTLKLESSVVP